MDEGGRSLVVAGAKDLEPLEIGDTAHSQIAGEAGIPKAYYDRMKSQRPELLDQSVNSWFRGQGDRAPPR